VIERYGSLPTLPEAVLAAVDSPGSPAEGAEGAGPDPVVEVLRSFGDDPVYRYLDVAREGNRLGYRLLREGRAGDAVRVFRAAAVLHPDDANGFDSLGEALVEAGDPTAAREAFERAVALDPDGRIGASSREWLRRLDEPPSPP
jgi:tetratricopeptide (TPR) repeat protein